MINFGSFFFSYIHIQCYKCSPSTVWLYPTKFDKLCFHFHLVQNILNFLMVLVVKNLLANAGDAGSISGLGRCPGGGNGNPLQYSCLENRMDRGAWRATVYGGAKSQTWLCTHVHSKGEHVPLLVRGPSTWIQWRGFSFCIDMMEYSTSRNLYLALALIASHQFSLL